MNFLLALVLATQTVVLAPKKRTEPWTEYYQPVNRNEEDGVRVCNPLKKSVSITLECGMYYEPIKVILQHNDCELLIIKTESHQNISGMCSLQNWRIAK